MWQKTLQRIICKSNKGRLHLILWRIRSHNQFTKSLQVGQYSLQPSGIRLAAFLFYLFHFSTDGTKFLNEHRYIYAKLSHLPARKNAPAVLCTVESTLFNFVIQ